MTTTTKLETPKRSRQASIAVVGKKAPDTMTSKDNASGSRLAKIAAAKINQSGEDPNIVDAQFSEIDLNEETRQRQAEIDNHVAAALMRNGITPPNNLAPGMNTNVRPLGQDRYSSFQASPGTQVNIDQRGQFYRPWKEEMKISFFRSLGKAIAFPFVLIGELIKGVLMGLLGIAKVAAVVLILPILIFKGMQYAEESKNKNAEQIAGEIGASSVGIANSVGRGLKDGMSKAPDKGAPTAP